jgi:hypothetical protein
VLATDRAFFWKHVGRFFLVTNWHNLAGLNPFTGEHLNAGGCIPDTIKIWPCTASPSRDTTSIARHVLELPLYEDFDQPFWSQHKQFDTNRADVAIILLPSTEKNVLNIAVAKPVKSDVPSTASTTVRISICLL